MVLTALQTFATFESIRPRGLIFGILILIFDRMIILMEVEFCWINYYQSYFPSFKNNASYSVQNSSFRTIHIQALKFHGSIV